MPKNHANKDKRIATGANSPTAGPRDLLKIMNLVRYCYHRKQESKVFVKKKQALPNPEMCDKTDHKVTGTVHLTLFNRRVGSSTSSLCLTRPHDLVWCLSQPLLSSLLVLNTN